MSTKTSGGLSRHFTTRRLRGNSDLNRNASISIRSKISGPVELIHTTNMLSYNAPDIQLRSASSTTSASTRSDDDSDSTAPTVASSNASSPPTSPDVASSSDRTSPEPNHLSCYFTPPAQATNIAPSKSSPAPVIPQRAVSHTKKNSDIISRQRSITRFSNQSTQSTSTKSSFSFSRSSSTSTATSHSSIMSMRHASKLSTASIASPLLPPPMPPSHHQKQLSENPFGQELAKVTEIAEEFGVKDKLQALDDDEKYLRDRGLSKFKAEDYIAEIQGLVASFFVDARPAPGPMWI